MCPLHAQNKVHAIIAFTHEHLPALHALSLLLHPHLVNLSNAGGAMIVPGGTITGTRLDELSLFIHPKSSGFMSGGSCFSVPYHMAS